MFCSFIAGEAPESLQEFLSPYELLLGMVALILTQVWTL